MSGGLGAVASEGRLAGAELQTGERLSRVAVGELVTAALVLSVVVLLVFGCALGYPFTNWDDIEYVARNPCLQQFSLANLQRLWRPGGVPGEMLYIPLTYGTFLLEGAVFGLRAAVCHGTNLVLHVGCALLVFALIRALGAGLAAAWFGALAFAVHPLQVEAVVWVMGRKDLLATLWALVALLAYLRHRATDHSRGWLATCVVAYVLAVLAKPSVIILPALLVLIDYYLDGRIERRAAMAKLPFVGAALAVYLPSAMIPQPGAADLPGFGLRCAALPAIATEWLGRWFLLTRPNPFYGWRPELRLADLLWGGLPGMVLVAGLLGYAWRRQLRWLWLGLLWTLIGFIPAAGLVLSGRRFMTADRYGYFPLIGACFLLGAVGERLPALHWRRVYQAVCLTWLIVAGVLASRQVPVWRSSVRLWETALTRNPRSALVRSNLGVAYAEAKRPADALLQFRRGLELQPDSVDLHHNLGRALLDLEQPAAAAKELAAAVALKPGDARLQISLADAYQRAGNLVAAEAAYRAAVRFEPDLDVAYLALGDFYLRAKAYAAAADTFNQALSTAVPSAAMYFGLGRALEGLGRFGEAEAQYLLALKRQPEFVGARYNLGTLYLRQQRHAEAEAEFRRVLTLAPEHYEAMVNLGIVLYAQGTMKEAETFLQQAIVDGGGAFPNAHYYLGLVYRAQGQTERAVIQMREALAHASPEQAAEIQRLLDDWAQPPTPLPQGALPRRE